MNAQRLEVTTTLSADRRLAILVITGELDLGTAERLWPSMRRLLDLAASESAGRPAPLEAMVVDATELEFLDSSGLRVLLRGARLAEDEGTAFRVVAVNPVVLRVLELSGAAHALDLRQSLAEAFA